MPVHKLPLIMVSNVQKNASFIHKFGGKISLPWEGGGSPLPHPPLAWSLRSLALPPLTNFGCTTVTGIANMHKGAMPPPPPHWSASKTKEERKEKENVSLKQIH